MRYMFNDKFNDSENWGEPHKDDKFDYLAGVVFPIGILVLMVLALVVFIAHHAS